MLNAEHEQLPREVRRAVAVTRLLVMLRRAKVRAATDDILRDAIWGAINSVEKWTGHHFAVDWVDFDDMPRHLWKEIHALHHALIAVVVQELDKIDFLQEQIDLNNALGLAVPHTLRGDQKSALSSAQWHFSLYWHYDVPKQRGYWSYEQMRTMLSTGTLISEIDNVETAETDHIDTPEAG